MPVPTSRAILLCLPLVLLGAAGCSGAPDRVEAAEISTASDLAAIRTATARFQDVNLALADGYIPDPSGMCVDAAMVGAPAEIGAMGIHYFRPDLLGITATEPRVDGNDGVLDFQKPEVLVYEPQADGSMQLVAVEYLVFEKAWQAAGNKSVPSFNGTNFFRMADDPSTAMDEAHGFEPHYELHLWLYRENPSGMFEEFNPAVTCANHKAHTAHASH